MDYIQISCGYLLHLVSTNLLRKSQAVYLSVKGLRTQHISGGFHKDITNATGVLKDENMIRKSLKIFHIW